MWAQVAQAMRRKLPPHGKAIAQARDDGLSITKVWVIYGNDWTLPAKAGQPALVVPGNYQPGTLDFSILIGLQVDIVCRRGGDDPISLGVEIQKEHAREINIHWIAGPGDWPEPEGKRLNYKLDWLFPHLEVTEHDGVKWRDDDN